MRHPDRDIVFYAVEKSVDMVFLPGVSLDLQRRVAIFPFLARMNVLPEMPGYLLQSVTYPKYWNTQFEYCRIDMRSLCLADRVRPA